MLFYRSLVAGVDAERGDLAAAAGDVGEAGGAEAGEEAGELAAEEIGREIDEHVFEVDGANRRCRVS